MRLPPTFRPLKDRAVLTVWSGLCTSTIGEDLFRVASVWLAVEAAGNMVGLVTGVQYVAMLVAGLFGGVLFDRWRADKAMIGSRIWSVAFSLLPVVGYYFFGISITLAGSFSAAACARRNQLWSCRRSLYIVSGIIPKPLSGIPGTASNGIPPAPSNERHSSSSTIMPMVFCLEIVANMLPLTIA